MSDYKPTKLTYFITRTAARTFLGDLKNSLKDVDRSTQLLHPKDIVTVGIASLGIITTALIGLLETIALPLEIAGDGINFVGNMRRKS